MVVGLWRNMIWDVKVQQEKGDNIVELENFLRDEREEFYGERRGEIDLMRERERVLSSSREDRIERERREGEGR